MTEYTKEFCANGWPFRAVHRDCPQLTEWCVRDVTGFAVANCEDEDAARAIADALNAANGKTP